MRDPFGALTDPAILDLGATIAAATAVVAVGARTHAGIGGAVVDAIEVQAPAGILDVQPSDMTVTVRAGTTCSDLDDALGEHGQECPLDPKDPHATVGGVLATGLSGLRRLGLGPVRNTVLEVVFVNAEGRVVRGGGPTVKNVTGYDIPRLFVGSLGTLGVLVQVTLRTQPRSAASQWFATPARGRDLFHHLFNPTTVASNGTITTVCLEGNPADINTQARAAKLEPGPAPVHPSGAHTGRISIDPRRLTELETALESVAGLQWLAEWGVGTVHVATDDVAGLAQAREIAQSHHGWMLREAGAPALDPFGTAFPVPELQRRIRRALDPSAKFSPGRVPATEPR